MNTTRWIAATLYALCAFAAQAGEMQIIVRKDARSLEVVRDGRIVERFPAALGFTPAGTKLRQGDGKTPEGSYVVRVRNAKSQFHLSLGIDYPNVRDAARGLKDGLVNRSQHDKIVAAARRKTMPPASTRLGGDIFIHGGGVGRDWTFGCVALENRDIERLFAMTPIGTRVDILP